MQKWNPPVEMTVTAGATPASTTPAQAMTAEATATHMVDQIVKLEGSRLVRIHAFTAIIEARDTAARQTWETERTRMAKEIERLNSNADVRTDVIEAAGRAIEAHDAAARPPTAPDARQNKPRGGW